MTENELLSNFNECIEAMKKFVAAYSVEEKSEKKVNLTLETTLYTELTPINPTMSKGRVRIFYTGLNRNRTFISEDFANQLIESLPYTPVKGIFNKEEVDYEDHGEDNADGRIYGIVMANPNFAWEDHLDEDGVVRTYACADVLYFTSLYPEAKIIPGSSQSMEIYRNTMEGEWKIWTDGEPYFHFEKGCLLGLQVLGTNVEPCFEGAAFYSLNNDLKEIVDFVKQFNEKEDEVNMEKELLFRLSDNQKASIIAAALNPNFTEEGNWEMSAYLLDVYDDYAIYVDMASGEYKRVYYSKEGDSISLGETVSVIMTDVTATENAALESMKATYTSFEKTAEELEALKASLEETTEKYENEVELNSSIAKQMEEKDRESEDKINSLQSLVNELNSSVEEYTKSIETMTAEKDEMLKEKEALISEKEALVEFKSNVETSKKEEILSKYSEYLKDSQISEFKEKLSDFSVVDFEKEVCFAASPLMYSSAHESDYIYTGKVDSNENLSEMEKILEKYKKGGRK